MQIRTFGDSGRQRECEGRLREINKPAQYATLLLLPIPTSRDGRMVSGTDTELSQLIEQVDERTLVAGYNIPEPYGELMAERGACIYDAGLDERFLSENADITARGALGRLMCELSIDIASARVGIVGYGRIGKRLLRYLLFLGASVVVYTGKDSTCTELSLLGASVRRIHDGIDLSSLDVLINTAPAHLIPDSAVDSLCGRLGIIDLASGSYVKAAEGVIKLSSVPDSMYPVSAGRLYAKYIAEYLFDDREERIADPL